MRAQDVRQEVAFKKQQQLCNKLNLIRINLNLSQQRTNPGAVYIYTRINAKPFADNSGIGAQPKK